MAGIPKTIINTTAVNKLKINNTEAYGAKINSTWFFLKAISVDLTNPKVGIATVSCSRTKSPNANAGTGTLTDGALVYFGDVLTVSATAEEGYNDPTISQSSITIDATFLNSYSSFKAISYVTAGSKKTYTLKFYEVSGRVYGETFSYGSRLSSKQSGWPKTEKISALIEVCKASWNSRKSKWDRGDRISLTEKTSGSGAGLVVWFEAEVEYEQNIVVEINTNNLFYGITKNNGVACEYLRRGTDSSDETVRDGWVNHQTGVYFEGSSVEGEPTYNYKYKYGRFASDDIAIIGYQTTLGGVETQLIYQAAQSRLDAIESYEYTEGGETKHDYGSKSLSYAYRWDSDGIGDRQASTGMVGGLLIEGISMPAHSLSFKFTLSPKQELDFDLADNSLNGMYFNTQDDGLKDIEFYRNNDGNVSWGVHNNIENDRRTGLPLGIDPNPNGDNFDGVAYDNGRTYPYGELWSSGGSDIYSSKDCYHALVRFPSTELKLQEYVRIFDTNNLGWYNTDIYWTFNPLSYNAQSGDDLKVYYNGTEMGSLNNTYREWSLIDRSSGYNDTKKGLFRYFYFKGTSKFTLADYQVGGVKIYAPTGFTASQATGNGFDCALTTYTE